MTQCKTIDTRPAKWGKPAISGNSVLAELRRYLSRRLAIWRSARKNRLSVRVESTLDDSTLRDLGLARLNGGTSPERDVMPFDNAAQWLDRKRALEMLRRR